MELAAGDAEVAGGIEEEAQPRLEERRTECALTVDQEVAAAAGAPGERQVDGSQIVGAQAVGGRDAPDVRLAEARDVVRARDGRSGAADEKHGRVAMRVLAGRPKPRG